MVSARLDAVVVGSGPNGLAAAITLAQAGARVLVVEANETVGGACRTAPLTLPGFAHDVCSSIHPMAAASPFLRALPLEAHGLTWVHPPAAIAHPLDGGRAALLEPSLDATAQSLGSDARAYRALFGPLVRHGEALLGDILSTMRRPSHPLLLARFGVHAVRSAHALAEACFETAEARALFAGMAAHSFFSLRAPLSATFGLLLGLLGHLVGWPFPARGAQAIPDALAAVLRSLGGEIRCGERVADLGALPPARAVLLDVTPRQVLAMAGSRLRGMTRDALEAYRYGPGVFKMDFALDGPVPWAAAACHRAATVHLGGTLEEITHSEQQVVDGELPERPYVLLAQHCAFDPARAPAGKHTVWAYCHVPNGSRVDMSSRIEGQIERFAPGFSERVLARTAWDTREVEAHNANLIGGDICAGAQDGLQLFARPRLRWNPYRLAEGLYLCSASTPPAPGVHGMCGHHAAKAVLADWAGGNARPAGLRAGPD